MTECPKGFKPHPYPYHFELNLKIESLTNLGLGIGRDKDWVIQVPYTLPGEKVTARIYRNHSNYSVADCLQIIEASPNRIEPPCTLFGECGGCQYQHATYDYQLEWKRKQVEDIFARITGVQVSVSPSIGSPKQYSYRSKLTPHYEKYRVASPLKIGFLKQGSRRTLMDVEQCPIATPAINESLPEARNELLKKKELLKKGGTLLLRDTIEGVVQDPKKLVEERVGRLLFQFRAGEFFQNNPFILPSLVDYVIQEASPGESTHLIDAYCGSGLFGLSASSLFEKVIGIEISKDGFLGAQANARLNRISNAEFLLGSAESIFGVLQSNIHPCTLVVDPPRKGCDADFLKQTLAFGPRLIVYVSCDPATQARDAKVLVAGGYVIEKIQPFDLFPQTRHIESVMTLRKNF